MMKAFAMTITITVNAIQNPVWPPFTYASPDEHRQN